jgi:dTDP-L-rhamnose 4-epimerase
MKILITGGAGFIGSELSLKLVKLGHSVYVIDKLSPQIHGSNPVESELYKKIEGKVFFKKADLSVEESWYLLEREFDVIFHLASETGTFQSMSNSSSHIINNILPTTILGDLLYRGVIKCNHIVFSSSRSVYGESDSVGSKESDSLHPKSVYAITKKTQEEIFFNSFSEQKISCLRLQNVYGNGQSLKNPYTGVLSIFSNAILHGKDITLFSDGKMTRDFVHISDVVDSFVLMLDREGFQKEIYNVGSADSVTILHLATRLKDIYESDIDININGQELSGDVRNCFANIDKISELGFEPKVSFEEGINEFANWVKSLKNIEYNNYEEVISSYR